MKYYLAIDIGASSGRHIIGYMDKDKLMTDEVYRFPNSVKLASGHLIWDIEFIFNNVLIGIKEALKKYENIESMSIDTWGVDYVLMNQDKEIYPCYAYRDLRTKAIISKVHSLISFDRLYEITGTQFQEFNTIYQLYSDMYLGRLDNATSFLHIPEYLMYKLTGKMVHEYTNASTTGLLDKDTNNYSNEIINKLGFNKNLFTILYKQGTLVGDFTNDIRKKVNGNIKVVLCSTHDTASAVEGMNIDFNTPYISSGTWSLLGIKTEKVINSEEAKRANYSNEYGPNYIRFQKNIMGLWIIQNLSREMNLDFSKMVELALESKYEEIYDVNDQVFLSSLKMKEEIINYFKVRNMIVPISDADVIHSTFRSLAYSYKVAIDELEMVTKQSYDKIYIVGGGAKNIYLNQLTSFYTKRKVIALPIEATAIGNILSQMEDK